MEEPKNTIAQVEAILSDILTGIQESSEPIQAGYLKALLDIAVTVEDHK